MIINDFIFDEIFNSECFWYIIPRSMTFKVIACNLRNQLATTICGCCLVCQNTYAKTTIYQDSNQRPLCCILVYLNRKTLR